jgi:hypothetical protein
VSINRDHDPTSLRKRYAPRVGPQTFSDVERTADESRIQFRAKSGARLTPVKKPAAGATEDSPVSRRYAGDKGLLEGWGCG